VHTENWGETVSDMPSQLVGTRYPGLFFNMNVQDMQKALAFGDWVQGTNNAHTNPALMCQLATFTYILLPNDHTMGASPGALTPQSFIEDNDEATGFLVDAVSHSPFWPDTLIVVIEDDPGDVGDHVDNHRSVMLAISPWARHGYTTHVHYDESSIHHTIELILGVPPHNEAVANAAPLYDLFTGTPDFTPFRYTPRTECETHNPMMGAFGQSASQMDFGQPDNAPGLGAMVWQMLHNGQPAPFRSANVPDEDGDGR
jgi:hypothetical protein